LARRRRRRVAFAIVVAPFVFLAFLAFLDFLGGLPAKGSVKLKISPTLRRARRVWRLCRVRVAFRAELLRLAARERLSAAFCAGVPKNLICLADRVFRALRRLRRGGFPTTRTTRFVIAIV